MGEERGVVWSSACEQRLTSSAPPCTLSPDPDAACSLHHQRGAAGGSGGGRGTQPRGESEE
ncbi:hypothetical protein E2C01_099652 [Portunus trituberculatus]|uniref:Uncharacterized protein n=1 Tax=Portunus trituberculatus TaxID=210409 RepID=A0A5B7KFG4_PORTR|nr:hypothetical protein [Portunus trituberculatus]